MTEESQDAPLVFVGRALGSPGGLAAAALAEAVHLVRAGQRVHVIEDSAHPSALRAVDPRLIIERCDRPGPAAVAGALRRSLERRPRAVVAWGLLDTLTSWPLLERHPEIPLLLVPGEHELAEVAADEALGALLREHAHVPHLVLVPRLASVREALPALGFSLGQLSPRRELYATQGERRSVVEEATAPVHHPSAAAGEPRRVWLWGRPGPHRPPAELARAAALLRERPGLEVHLAPRGTPAAMASLAALLGDRAVLHAPLSPLAHGALLAAHDVVLMFGRPARPLGARVSSVLAVLESGVTPALTTEFLQGTGLEEPLRALGCGLIEDSWEALVDRIAHATPAELALQRRLARRCASVMLELEPGRTHSALLDTLTTLHQQLARTRTTRAQSACVHGHAEHGLQPLSPLSFQADKLSTRRLQDLPLLPIAPAQRTRYTPRTPEATWWMSPGASEREVQDTLRRGHRLGPPTPINVGYATSELQALEGPSGLVSFAVIKSFAAQPWAEPPPGLEIERQAAAEVAAYRLSRALRLHLVPPTVLRDFDGRVCSVQLYVDGAQNLSNLVYSRRYPLARVPRRQLLYLTLLDVVLGNSDRQPPNCLLVRDGRVARLVAIDHSHALYTTPPPRLRVLDRRGLWLDEPGFVPEAALDAKLRVVSPAHVAAILRTCGISPVAREGAVRRLEALAHDTPLRRALLRAVSADHHPDRTTDGATELLGAAQAC